MRIAKGLLLLLGAWIGLAAAFSGCTCVVNNYHYGTARPSAMYVANGPPAPKEETRTASPEEGFVWISGHWEWSGSEETWVWVGGVWVEPPDEGATWVDPEYEDNNGDWMYVPGHWQWDDPGAPEGEEEGSPGLKPGDLQWVDGPEVGTPGDQPTEPAEPKIPPGTFQTPETKILPGTFQTVTPKDEKTPEPGPTGVKTPKADGDAEKTPPHALEAAGGDVEEDPYGTVESAGDDKGKGSKKIKKPGTKEVKPDKPEMPDVVEHPKTIDEPAAKHHKKHKAKPESKDEGKVEPQIKEPDKAKPKAKTVH